MTTSFAISRFLEQKTMPKRRRRRRGNELTFVLSYFSLPTVKLSRNLGWQWTEAVLFFSLRLWTSAVWYVGRRKTICRALREGLTNDGGEETKIITTGCRCLQKYELNNACYVELLPHHYLMYYNNEINQGFHGSYGSDPAQQCSFKNQRFILYSGHTVHITCQLFLHSSKSCPHFSAPQKETEKCTKCEHSRLESPWKSQKCLTVSKM